jgi:hypothetical protein
MNTRASAKQAMDHICQSDMFPHSNDMFHEHYKCYIKVNPSTAPVNTPIFQSARKKKSFGKLSNSFKS